MSQPAEHPESTPEPVADAEPQLPALLLELLSEYRYKGESARIERIEQCVPTVLHLSVDLKLPAEGPPKILELNGTTSGFSGYPGGEREIHLRAQEVDRAAGLGYLFFGTFSGRHVPENTSRDWLLGIDRDIGVEGMSVPWGVRYQVSQMDREAGWGRSWDFRHDDLTEVPLGLYHHGVQDHLGYGDPDQVVVMNPGAIRFLVDRKDAFADFCQAAGLEHLRPKSWNFYGRAPEQVVDQVLRESVGIDWLMIKASHFGQGSRMVPVPRRDFEHAMAVFFRLEARAEDGQLLQEEFREWREDPIPFLVEEYVPSYALKAADRLPYDQTMRVVIRAIANRETLATVPLGAYWKRPAEPVVNDWPEAFMSDLKNGGSQRISQADLKRSFAGVAELTRALVEGTRATDRATRLLDC